MRSLRVLCTLVAVVLTSSLAVAPVRAAPPVPMLQTRIGSPLAGVPADSRQVIAVGSPDAGSTYATLTAWEKLSDGSWARRIGPVAARVGSRGIGPAEEGSQYTPAGTMHLDQSFGRLANPGTKLPYFVTDPLDWWDENPSSSTYNLHVRRSSSPGGASENLYYSGSAYNYGVNMAWNPGRVPGAGSAFFLHVSTGNPTAGCVSIPQADLQAILRWLDPAEKPVITTRVGAAWMPGNLDTRLSQTTPSTTVAKGTLKALRGTLTTTTKQQLSAPVVQIFRQLSGSATWTRIGTTALRSGSYSFTFRPAGPAARYQVRWPGNATWERAQSGIVTFAVR